jgi:hypothetical protein
MRVSGMVSTLQYANQNLYVSSRYNQRPVQKVQKVPQRDYSINMAVKNQITRSMTLQPSGSTMSFSSRAVVLPNGAIFVGTIIDLIA